MTALPTGTVTFLFTDVEGSTRLLQELGDGYAEALAAHRRALRGAFERYGGVEVDTQGDAFFVAFGKASDALNAAAAGREALGAGPIKVRMGLHTGEPVVTDEGYVGIDVHRAARIAATGHGGQILVSQSTRDLVGVDSLRDLGEHRLKDLTAPERIFQFGDSDYPPLKSLNQTNLPVQPTPFVGRHRELLKVLELLRSSRLLTLTGPGGSGKTRLALQSAAELVDDMPDGVWFVSLAALTDPELVLPTIASALGTSDDLDDFLRPKCVLLLLDNLEQLLPHVALPLAGLLEAPKVKLLVTSRERLALSAEQEYLVPTLPEEDAVALFTNRARQLKPSFEPDEHVVEIARCLDGLPLALELAAARVKVLTPLQIVERLGKGLALLSSGARDLPERQRTLRAAIEWSYDLLDEPEQRLFVRLAVFSGSFDLEAAEAVCEADVDGLQSLVDKSLLRQGEAGRFFLLETVRGYATERFGESEDAPNLRKRHALFFAALGEQAEARMVGPEQGEWFVRLDRDLDNMRSALGWSLETGPVEVGLGLASALRRFWWIRGHVREGLTYLESLLEATTVVSSAWVAALKTASILALIGGDLDRARRFATDAVAATQEIADEDNLVDAFATLAAVENAAGEYLKAAELFQKSRALADETGNVAAAAAATHNLGNVALAMGDFAGAAQFSEESLTRARRLGHTEGVAGSLEVLGIASLELGEYTRAFNCLRESLELCLELGFQVGVAYAVEALGALAVRRDRYREGIKLIAAAEAFLASVNVSPEPAERFLKESAIASARTFLKPDSFVAAWADGAGTNLEVAARAAIAP